MNVNYSTEINPEISGLTYNMNVPHVHMLGRLNSLCLRILHIHAHHALC